MVFWIIIALIVIITVWVGIEARDEYDHGAIVVGTFFISALFGLFAFGLTSLIGAAASPKVVTNETTYTVVQSNTPQMENGYLTFVYEKNGTSNIFKEYVHTEELSLDKPSKIVATHYDVVNPWIAPWPLNDETHAKFIK